MPTIADIRKQYPDYNDMSDQQLADALHTKFYSDMPQAEYYQKIGMSSQPAPAPKPKSGIMDTLADFGRRAGKSTLSTLDLPNDLINMIAGKQVLDPIGSNAAEYYFGKPASLEDKGFLYKTGATAADIAGQLPAMLVGAGSASIPKLLKTLLPSMAGQAVGGGIAKTLAPDSPIADLVGQLAGGFTPAASQMRSAAKNVESLINKRIDKMFQETTNLYKGATASRYQKEVGKGRDAVKDIVANKDNFVLTDIEGNAVKNKLPETAFQQAQAAEQQKRKLITELKTRKADAGNVMIETESMANSLDKVINNKSIQTRRPQVIELAQAYKNRLLQQKALTIDDLDQMIIDANNDLHKWYQNPAPDIDTQLALDAVVMEQGRKDLNNAIKSVTGEGIDDIKRQLGNVLAIEPEINKTIGKAARHASRINKIDFWDITSSAGALTALASGQPGILLPVTGMQVLKRYRNYLASPDRQIRTTYKIIDELSAKLPKKPAGMGAGEWGHLESIEPEKPKMLTYQKFQTPGTASAERTILDLIKEGEGQPMGTQLRSPIPPHAGNVAGQFMSGGFQNEPTILDKLMQGQYQRGVGRRMNLLQPKTKMDIRQPDTLMTGEYGEWLGSPVKEATSPMDTLIDDMLKQFEAGGGETLPLSWRNKVKGTGQREMNLTPRQWSKFKGEYPSDIQDIVGMRKGKTQIPDDLLRMILGLK